jgi:2'-hydroxyisoflavone reductase
MNRALRLLVLGGSKFLGRAVVEAALARGHEVTLFNRGQTNPELFPEVEKLRGDRDGDHGALEGRKWDAVVDTSGFVPRQVETSTRLLAGTGHYAFVSTGNVYADFAHGPLREDDELATLPEDVEEDDQQAYGPLKAQCERVVLDAFGERALIARSGLLVGPHDGSGRFAYWPHRVARGGRVLAPGPDDRLVQFIDARDTADWLVRTAEENVGGVFNVAGVPRPLSDLLDTSRAVTESDAEIVWVDHDFLIEHEVGEWMELPLWISDPEWKDFMNKDVSRALAAGLTFRPLEDTVRATLELAAPVEDVGLSPEREAELLATWAGIAA